MLTWLSYLNKLVLLNQSEKGNKMYSKQIYSIIKDYRDEPDNNLSADTALAKVVCSMIKNQSDLLPIQKEALSLYLAGKEQDAIADKFDVTNKYDR